MGLSTTQLKFFADYIQKELGIIYSADNYFQLEKRLVEISKSLNLENEEILYKKAQEGISGATRQMLLDVSTNNETSFFRDPKIFSAIEKLILPEWRKDNPQATQLRVWCAASSFGQEPYSLAMLLTEIAHKDIHMPKFEIIATDISEKALARAKEGLYSPLEVGRGLPEALKSKYFVETPSGHSSVSAEIRGQVQYRKQNLLDPMTLLGDFDLILCRNVLIYQTEEKKREIVLQIHKRITKRGFLVLGSAEGLMGFTEQFDQICKEGSIYFQKK